jgi:hypothetical protein
VGGYAASAGGYQPAPAAQPGPSALGVIAFVLSAVAALVAPIVVGVAGYQMGFRLPSVTEYADTGTTDLSFFAPVRDQVLMGEIGFWTGTLVGIVAIVLGIMAIARRRGRAGGVVALILAGIGPVLFVVVFSITLIVGAGAGAATYYGA